MGRHVAVLLQNPDQLNERSAGGFARENCGSRESLQKQPYLTS